MMIMDSQGIAFNFSMKSLGLARSAIAFHRVAARQEESILSSFALGKKSPYSFRQQYISFHLYDVSISMKWCSLTTT